MSVAQQAAFPLSADGEMIELVERDRRKQWEKGGRGKGSSRDMEVQVWECISLKSNNVKKMVCCFEFWFWFTSSSLLSTGQYALQAVTFKKIFDKSSISTNI